MGTSTPPVFAAKMHRVAGVMRAADGGDPKLLRKAGWAIADSLNASAVGVGATRFAGRPLRGWRVIVAGDTAYIRPGNPGAAVALNSGTAAHRITPKRARSNQPRGPRALAGNGFGPRAAANHPGTSGKRFVRRGFDAGSEKAGRVVKDELVRQIRVVLG